MPLPRQTPSTATPTASSLNGRPKSAPHRAPTLCQETGSATDRTAPGTAPPAHTRVCARGQSAVAVERGAQQTLVRRQLPRVVVTEIQLSLGADELRPGLRDGRREGGRAPWLQAEPRVVRLARLGLRVGEHPLR